MEIINLTSPEKAFAYLESLPSEHHVSLSGPYGVKSADDVAVEVITGLSSHLFASNENRWEWSVEELLKTLKNNES